MHFSNQTFSRERTLQFREKDASAKLDNQVQMNRGPDIAPVMDKAPEPKGVPEQAQRALNFST